MADPQPKKTIAQRFLSRKGQTSYQGPIPEPTPGGSPGALKQQIIQTLRAAIEKEQNTEEKESLQYCLTEIEEASTLGALVQIMGEFELPEIEQISI